MKDNRLPLKGLKIISVEQYGAAPFGTMYLADLGAEVIKVENHHQGGDMGRHVVPYAEEGDSLFFQTFSCNKKSIAIDLKSKKGQLILQQMATNANALINNLRGDLPDKLGLTYSHMSNVNKTIVCVHLSAYGRNNERSGWPGLDYVMQAEAGYLAITGEPDSPPTRMGLSIVDFMGGLTAALALLAGIIGAKAKGQGQDYDTSLFDVAMANLSYPATWHLNEGYEPERVKHSGHPSLVPSEMYKTSDGWIFIMANKSNFWPILCEALGKPEWETDPRMNSFKTRLENRDIVVKLLSSVFIKNTTDVWLEKLRGKLPCAPVNNIGEALKNDFISNQKIIQNVPREKTKSLKMVRQPILIDSEIAPRKPAPKLGADTHKILSNLGYSEMEIDTLKKEGVIGR